MAIQLRGLLAAVGLFMLAACGGGGGSGGGGGPSGGGGSSPPPAGAPNYVGATAAADIASGSAVPPMSGWLLLELGLTDGLDYVSIAGQPSGVAAAKPSRLSIQKRFGKARQHAVTLASAKTINAVTTENCDVSGTADINDDGLRTDGTGVLVLTFRDCAEGDGTTLNGVVRVTVAAFDSNRQEPSDYTINFENVRVTAGTDSVEAGGSLRIVVTGSTTRTTRNTVARYLPENVYIRLQDLVETSTVIGPVGTPATNVLFGGRFYHSQYGYVDVQTPLSLLVDFSGTPLGGRMALVGTSAGARAELRFRDQGRVVIVLEVTGAAERALIISPADLLQPITNFAPFAEVAGNGVTAEGETVTFDAGGSRDWEGAPLTYSWSVTAGPVMAGLFPTGTGRTYSMTPPLPGVYDVVLTVSDGTNSTSTRVFVTALDVPGPLAHAGSDRTTVERSTVTLDASGTTHPNVSLDSLQFTWTRVSAPAGSSAPTTLTGIQPQVAIDVPGTYEYRVSAGGRGGVSTDTVIITAEPLVAASSGTFNVTPNTQAANTTFAMPIRVHASYTGAPLSLSISSNVNWLTIDTPNVTTATTSVIVRLNLNELATLGNDFYEGVVRIVPTGGYSEWDGTFSLDLQLPEVQQISPYVVYTGQLTSVNLSGDQLHLASGRVVVGGQQVQTLTRASTYKARAEFPALTPGEYTVNVTNALGIARPGARLVVRDPPAHPDSEVTLPATPYSIEYDPERDVFYGVFGTDAAEYFARRFYRLANGTWQFDEIAVPNPRAVTIALGGGRLLFTSGNCGVYEVDAVTLQTVASELRPGCVSPDFGLIAALADGDVIFGDRSGPANVKRYPGFEFYGLLPNVVPAAMLSHDRSRMLWGQSNPGTGESILWVFDVLGGQSSATPTTTLVTSSDGTVRLGYSLAISGNGSRFINHDDVYDNSYRYVGSLQGLGTANISSALSRRGTRAVVYNHDTDELRLFDVTASTNNIFPSLGLLEAFPEEVSAGPVYFPDDTAVFMWASVRTNSTPGSETYEHRLIVRGLP